MKKEEKYSPLAFYLVNQSREGRSLTLRRLHQNHRDAAFQEK